MPNTYSRQWFELFLQTQPNTDTEVSFITRHLPVRDYKLVLDLGCGEGRHANLLALFGYEMVGVDNSGGALAEAKRYASPSTVYLEQDMRKLADLPFSFDAAICLWQSFGYFDEATNRHVLAQLTQKIRSKGRLILDLYHREFFEVHQGTQRFTRQGIDVIVTNIMHGGRLTSFLQYSNGKSDNFEWQLYTPDEVIALAGDLGFTCLVACTNFDEAQPASAESTRMQLVFEQRLR